MVYSVFGGRHTLALLAALPCCSLTIGASALANAEAGIAAIVHGERVPLTPAAGARVFDAPFGRAVEPDRSGHAATLDAPSGIRTPSGTIELRFRLSAPVYAGAGRDSEILTIFDTPAIRAELVPHAFMVLLRVTTLADGRDPVRGHVYLSHLKAARWYHLAIAWDPPSGSLEAFINGVAQQQLRRGDDFDKPWKAGFSSGQARFGAAGRWGGEWLRLAVGEIHIHPRALTEDQVARPAGDRLEPLDGEGRTIYPPGRVAHDGWAPTLVYEADFSKPLSLVHEDDLFDGDRRVAKPDGYEWALEGPGRAWTESNRLFLATFLPGSQPGHVVLWNTRKFPEDFILDFDFSPHDSNRGLAIVFFCATPHADPAGTVFDLHLPRRGGIFRNYHSDALDNYHTSFFATDPQPGSARRSTNFRKNRGFVLVAAGDDNIVSAGPGPHRVRIVKAGRQITIESRGRITTRYIDDERFGPVLGSGAIGLRLMEYSAGASYGSFRVYELTKFVPR